MADSARLTALIATWRSRCKKLADEGKFWEAGRLSEAASELQAIVTDGKVLTTDQQIRESYERALPPQASPNWPGHWPSATPLYQPIPGIYPATRVVD